MRPGAQDRRGGAGADAELDEGHRATTSRGVTAGRFVDTGCGAGDGAAGGQGGWGRARGVVGLGGAALTGELAQVPRAVSAIKVNGRRSYARERAGQGVVLPTRPVTVHSFDILGQRTRTVQGHLVWDVDVIVEVSSGTYIRALARDLGAALGVGGHLTALRRTRVGRFGIEGAHSLTDLEIASEADGIPVVALSEAARASFDVRELTPAEATAIGYGQRVASQLAGRNQPVAAFAPDGHLVAMLDESGSLAKARVVFAPLGS